VSLCASGKGTDINHFVLKNGDHASNSRRDANLNSQPCQFRFTVGDYREYLAPEYGYPS
jgi:hypothetical protein